MTTWYLKKKRSKKPHLNQIYNNLHKFLLKNDSFHLIVIPYHFIFVKKK